MLIDNLQVGEDSVVYGIISNDEICVVCGAYTNTGQVCNRCLKEYDLYEEPVGCIDGI